MHVRTLSSLSLLSISLFSLSLFVLSSHLFHLFFSSLCFCVACSVSCCAVVLCVAWCPRRWQRWVIVFQNNQFKTFKMYPHFLSNFAVSHNHETTVGSQIEILTSFAHYIVYTNESSVQRWAQSVLIVTLKLSSSMEQEYIHDWLFDENLRFPLPLGGNVFCAPLLCPNLMSSIQTSDCSMHQEQNFQVKMSLRDCHRLVPNLHATQPNSNHHSMHRNSNHQKNQELSVWGLSTWYVSGDSWDSALLSDFGFLKTRNTNDRGLT